MLPQLLDQIPPDQEIASVTADGAYDTRKCHDAIAERGAVAVIPQHRNAKPWKAVTRQVPSRATRPCGRRNTSAVRSGDDGAATTAEAASKYEEDQKKVKGNRKLSGGEFSPERGSFSRRLDALCEPKVREAKLLGQRLMARDRGRQVAEFQVRVAVLNGFTALGILANTNCRTPEQYKAWSLNLGHENIATTLSAYCPVSTTRQGELIRDMALSPVARLA